MTRVQQKQKRPISTSCRVPKFQTHQNPEHDQNLKQHRFPSDSAFKCAFNIPLLALLGWEQKKTLIMSLSWSRTSAGGATIRRLWRRIGKYCGWECPRAPEVRWLWNERATGAVVERLEDTRVGCRTSARAVSGPQG